MTSMALPVFLPEIEPNGRRALPPRIPHATHRHAAPTGPWPWSDLVENDIPIPYPLNLPSLDEKKDSGSPENELQDENWGKYPGSLFPNWTQHQITRSGIARAINKKLGKAETCVIYHLDVGTDGHFSEPGKYCVTDENEHDFWTMLTEKRPDRNRVRLLFVENLSGGILQMLGTIYKIEPFFFSSSLNWIPSRYQEHVRQNRGDHITVTLTFLRTMPNPMTAANTPNVGNTNNLTFAQVASQVGTTTIDTQAPLILRSNDRILLLDLLAFHMVRRKEGSTVISYHPTPEWKSTSAQYLHSRVRYVGESVYWQSLFRQSQDPTFVLLSMLWYSMYAWDEALENLYAHICWLESRVLVTNNIHLTRELHIIRASLLHYTSLLENFRKAVIFIRNTPNPAIQDLPDYNNSADLLNKECDNLISEIERLEMFRRMQEMRLENVLNLAFASVSFEDSRETQRLSQTSLRDGEAMKQISYLTMVFLPASFVATIFGMNLSNLQSGSFGTVANYLAVSLPLTAVTIWIIVGLHSSKTYHDEPETSLFYRLRWPIRSLKKLFKRRQRGGFEGVV
ncbi:hypothetical protein GALMADRAFT_148072 [Galerina marginata CBS 339.88]|uniref:Uncharacterized protein n=1 Tax=Galerina marginata (strain CBS 339.88) TaxID=685588 RepID=A0A067S8A3_GALM3|nr:hypothetical protein GALMADRAFT_148072 [Galerina marginata CBS 339.88]